MSNLAQPLSFEKLDKRYRLRAELVAVSGLRVGAGKSMDAAATDQPVIRDALGQPYIPGSSLKGVLRSGLEAILRSLGRRDFWACGTFENRRRPSQGDAPRDPSLDRCVGDADVDQNRKIELAEVLKRSCTACSLFGSQFLAGRIFIHDLPRASGSPTEVRDGVGIDRDLGTAQAGIKYDVEVVPVGTRFKLEMLLENVDPLRLALVLQALQLLHQGELLLGGLTTRGLGRVKLDKVHLEHTNAARLLMGQGYETTSYEQELQKAGELLASHLDQAEEKSYA